MKSYQQQRIFPSQNEEYLSSTLELKMLCLYLTKYKYFDMGAANNSINTGVDGKGENYWQAQVYFI